MNNDEIRNSKCGDVFGHKNLWDWDTPYSYSNLSLCLLSVFVSRACAHTLPPTTNTNTGSRVYINLNEDPSLTGQSEPVNG